MIADQSGNLWIANNPTYNTSGTINSAAKLIKFNPARAKVVNIYQ